MMARFKVGDTVLVPWGVQRHIKGKVVEVWDDADDHVRVELKFDDDAEPSTLLLSASILRAA